MEMKKSIVIMLILLLAISTQAFASPKINISANDQKVEVSDEGEGEATEEIEAEQTIVDSEEKLKLEWSGELTNNLDEDNSTNAEPLCWICTKIVEGGGHPCSNSNDEISILTSSSLTDVAITSSEFQTDCYVPKYKVCVDGFWSPVCPIK